MTPERVRHLGRAAKACTTRRGVEPRKTPSWKGVPLSVRDDQILAERLVEARLIVPTDLFGTMVFTGVADTDLSHTGRRCD